MQQNIITHARLARIIIAGKADRFLNVVATTSVLKCELCGFQSNASYFPHLSPLHKFFEVLMA